MRRALRLGMTRLALAETGLARERDLPRDVRARILADSRRIAANPAGTVTDGHGSQGAQE